MRKSGFSLGLIIVSNVLIIVISLVCGLHVLPYSSQPQKALSSEVTEEFRDLTIKQS